MKQTVFLLADDDSDDREMFSEAMMEVSGTAVCYAVENGREVLEKLAAIKEPPHLIFLDINMPVMNGWECLKQLKDTAQYRHIPVIIYSTSSHQREVDEAKSSGAICFVTKPVSYSKLKAFLSLVVARAGEGLVDALQEYCSTSPGAGTMFRN